MHQQAVSVGEYQPIAEHERTFYWDSTSVAKSLCRHDMLGLLKKAMISLRIRPVLANNVTKYQLECKSKVFLLPIIFWKSSIIFPNRDIATAC